MAISKNKVKLQITLPKDDAETLTNLVAAFREKGYSKLTKSDVLTVAFRGYVNVLLQVSKENSKEEKKDA